MTSHLWHFYLEVLEEFAPDHEVWDWRGFNIFTIIWNGSAPDQIVSIFSQITRFFTVLKFPFSSWSIFDQQSSFNFRNEWWRSFKSCHGNFCGNFPIASFGLRVCHRFVALFYIDHNSSLRIEFGPQTNLKQTPQMKLDLILFSFGIGMNCV